MVKNNPSILILEAVEKNQELLAEKV